MAKRAPSYPGDRRALGAAGERAAAEWYEANGYKVVDKNWRSRTGEVDLVAARDGAIVFCEVKTRRTDTYGAPYEAVTHVKRRRIRSLASQWLRASTHSYGEVRFDVASVYMGRDGDVVVEITEEAF